MPRKYMFAPVVLDPALGERQIMVVASTRRSTAPRT